MSTPVELNELQVERVIHLWWKFKLQATGVIEQHDAMLVAFIDWLESGQPEGPITW